MWDDCDREWREALWRHTMNAMPVEALVNLPGGGFSLRDNGNASIYADDIDEKLYARMLDEWSALLGCDAPLLRELNLETLERHFAAGEQAFNFQPSTKLGELEVRVSFRGAPEQEPFVIRLEPEKQRCAAPPEI